MLGENDDYQYLGILETITMKQMEMKENIGKVGLRRSKELPENKLCSRNVIKGISTWAVPFVRY